MPLADIVGFDRSSQLKLVAEVKNRRDVTPEWATQFRRNLMAHGRVFPVLRRFEYSDLTAFRT